MVWTDARMVGPRRERAEVSAEEHAGEGEDGSDEGAGPASAQVGEFRDGLSEENLISVALEVAENGCAEDGGDNDDAEQSRAEIVVGVGVRSIEQDFAIAAADWSEVFGRDIEEREREPQQRNKCRSRCS